MANTPSLAAVGTVPAIAYAGQDLSPYSQSDSYQNESTTAIEPGAPVARGTVMTPTQPMNETCKPFGADTDEFLGFSLRYPIKAASSNAVSFAQYDTVPVKRLGRCAVTVAENVTKGDNVMILTASPGTLGSSRNGVATTGRILAVNWEYATTTSANGVAIVEFTGHPGKVTT